MPVKTVDDDFAPFHDNDLALFEDDDIGTGSNSHRATDIATALASLNIKIEQLKKHIQEEVTKHYDTLLSQVTHLHTLQHALQETKTRTSSLNNSLERLRLRVTAPFESARNCAIEGDRVQSAIEILRSVVRIVALSKRLEDQVGDSVTTTFKKDGSVDFELDKLTPEKRNSWRREMLPMAAITINEISYVSFGVTSRVRSFLIKPTTDSSLTDSVMTDHTLPNLTSLSRTLKFIKAASSLIISESLAMLTSSFKSGDQSLTSLTLLVWHNMGILEEQVVGVVNEWMKLMDKEMKYTFDVVNLNREVKESKKFTDPNAVAAAWVNALWDRMDRFFSSLYNTASNVYQLSRMLKISRTLDGTTYAALISAHLQSDLVTHFWKRVSATFESHIKLSTKSSALLQQTFQVQFPKFLRIFRGFARRLDSIHRSYSYDSSSSSTNPEELLYGPLAVFETAYISRSLSRLFEPINIAFPEHAKSATRNPPNHEEVDKLGRIVKSEVEMVLFERGLLKSVAKNIAKSLSLYGTKCEDLHQTDASAYSITGPHPPTQSQLINIEIINCINRLIEHVWAVVSEDDLLCSMTIEPLNSLAEIASNVLKPLAEAVVNDCASTIAKMHKEDFVRPSASRQPDSSACSQYVMELGFKIKYIQKEIMSRLSSCSTISSWIQVIVTRLLRIFLHHLSINGPIGDSGRLRITNDLAQVEFIFDSWLQAHGIRLSNEAGELGDVYKALRGFRPLLFADLDALQSQTHTSTLHTIHHLFVRSNGALPLPTTCFAWDETQYLQWIDNHEEAEHILLLEQCLSVYVDSVKNKGETAFIKEFVVVRELIELWKTKL